MDILFNKEGTPLMMQSTAVFGESTGRPANYEVKKRDILAPFESLRTTYTEWKGHRILEWGEGNDFPLKAAKVVSETSVLNTGLRFLRNLTLGQGLFACRVEGYDEKGNEKLKPVDDAALAALLGSRMVRRYTENASRDYFKFGCSPVELVPDAAGKRIIGLNAINALYTRFTVPDTMGRCKCIVSGCWPSLPETTEDDQPRVLDTLMDYDPQLEYDTRFLQGKLKQPLVYALRDSWSNHDVYSEPVWLPAYILGWIDIAQQVPKFLKKAYENQISWKWHVQIPYSFWDRRFPMQDYQQLGTEKRKADIQKYMDDIERNLTGVENAEKPLMTMYAVNEANAKVEEEWKIQALDNKYKGGENLVTSAAANSEILFTLGVNPNVFGAGMPGGTYAGNQGGSNIREAFLVNIANAWVDRQNLLDPIYLLLRSWGYGDDVQLRYRNTILTTLDTGAGTKKTLS